MKNVPHLIEKFDQDENDALRDAWHISSSFVAGEVNHAQKILLLRAMMIDIRSRFNRALQELTSKQYMILLEPKTGSVAFGVAEGKKSLTAVPEKEIVRAKKRLSRVMGFDRVLTNMEIYSLWDIQRLDLGTPTDARYEANRKSFVDRMATYIASPASNRKSVWRPDPPLTG